MTSSLGKAERVGRVQLSNCVSADISSAMLEVDNVQARNRRARHTTYHLMLSFREQPPSEVLQAIEQRACAALGFSDHQRVSVVHHDTDHLHLHIAINRVNPVTYKVHCPSYSKLALDSLCVELERDYGLQPDRHATQDRQPQLQAIEQLRTLAQRECAAALRQARSWGEVHRAAEAHGLRAQLRGNGLALVAADGVSVKASTVSRDLSKAALERRLGPFEATQPTQMSAEFAQPDRLPKKSPNRTPDMERIAGVESLVGWIQRGCADALRQACNWAEVHEVAQRNGLRVQLRGSGLVFVAAHGLSVKASTVSRDLSKLALERRLGPFEATRFSDRVALMQYRKGPMPQQKSAARLYERYLQDRAAALDRRNHAVGQLREQRGEDDARLRRTSQRRWTAIRLVARGRVGWMLWSAYARQADRRDRERARQKHRASVRAAAAQHRRTGWLEWLRQSAARGDAEALAALRSRSCSEHLAQNALWGDGSAKDLSRTLVDSVTATGTVIYRVPGGSVRDDGTRLHLIASASSDLAAEALLRLAHARYGRSIGVDGDDNFRARMVRAAVSTALPITFADEPLERRRVELERKEHANDRPGTQGPPPHAGRDRAPLSTGRGYPGTQARAGVPRSNRGYPRRQASTEPNAGLRSVSALDVVRFGDAPEVLLPRDARRNVEQR
ncbi:MAG TPA: TraI/MobA(P) family conjugative relaxase, partial [Polyangiales bacterium]